MLVLVLGIAAHSETKEQFVTYVPLGANHGARIVVRPLELFWDEVEVDGKKVSHFIYVGETLDKQISKDYDSLSGYTGKDRIEIDC